CRDLCEVVQGGPELFELPDDGADGARHDGHHEHDGDEGMDVLRAVDRPAVAADRRARQQADQPGGVRDCRSGERGDRGDSPARHRRTAPPREDYLRKVNATRSCPSWLRCYFTLTTITAEVQQHWSPPPPLPELS